MRWFPATKWFCAVIICWKPVITEKVSLAAPSANSVRFSKWNSNHRKKKHYAKFTVTANERSARFFKRHRFSYPSKVKVKLNIISGEKTDFQLTTNYPSAVVVGENTNLSLALTPHRANGSLSCWRWPFTIYSRSVTMAAEKNARSYRGEYWTMRHLKGYFSKPKFWFWFYALAQIWSTLIVWILRF